MKRILKWILTGLNGLLILILLLFSGCMLYFSAASPAEIGGFAALLFDPSTEAEGDDIFCLLQVRPDTLSAGDLVLLEGEDGPGLYPLFSEDGQLCCLTGAAEPLPVSPGDPAFGGKVIYQNQSLGSLLAAASAPGNLLFTYLLTGGGFLLAALILLGIYLLSTRRFTVDGVEGEEEAEEETAAQTDAVPPVTGFSPTTLKEPSPPETAPQTASWKPWKPPLPAAAAPDPMGKETSPSREEAAETAADEISFTFQLPSRPAGNTAEAPPPSEQEDMSPSHRQAEGILEDLLKEFQDGLIK